MLQVELTKAIASVLMKHSMTGSDPDLLTSEVTKALGVSAMRATGHAKASVRDIPMSIPEPETDEPNLFTQKIADLSNELAPNIIKLLEAGFKTYIPLSSCTHKSCQLASRSAEAFDSEISMNEKGEIKLKHKAMNVAHDHQMSTNDFLQVRENLIPAIHKHLILAGKTAKGAPPQLHMLKCLQPSS
jgi:hypothetical protein